MLYTQIWLAKNYESDLSIDFPHCCKNKRCDIWAKRGGSGAEKSDSMISFTESYDFSNQTTINDTDIHQY